MAYMFETGHVTYILNGMFKLFLHFGGLTYHFGVLTYHLHIVS